GPSVETDRLRLEARSCSPAARYLFYGTALQPAAADLRVIGVRHRCRLLRCALHPGVASPGPARIALVPGIVCEVEAVGVIERDAVPLVAAAVIPSDKVDRVAEIVARGAPPSGFVLVLGPGSVQRLGVAVGARR